MCTRWIAQQLSSGAQPARYLPLDPSLPSYWHPSIRAPEVTAPLQLLMLRALHTRLHTDRQTDTHRGTLIHSLSSDTQSPVAGDRCSFLGWGELGRVVWGLSHLPASPCAPLLASRGAFYHITQWYPLGRLNRHATL